MAEKLINIQIKKEGIKNPDLFIKSLELMFGKEPTKRAFNNIKKTVLNDVNLYINSHRQRKGEVHEEGWRASARNNLFNAIKEGSTVEASDNSSQKLGIGNEKILNQMTGGKGNQRGYWKVVNNGGRPRVPAITLPNGKVIYGFFGHFDRSYPKPMTDRKGGDQVFKLGAISGKIFLMNPKSKIPPMYYLERMAGVFEIEMSLLHDNIKSSINNTAKQLKNYSDTAKIIPANVAAMLEKNL